MLKRLLLIVCAILLGTVGVKAENGAYHIYPVPEGVYLTDMFDVEVSADSLEWERVPVVMTLVGNVNL